MGLTTVWIDNFHKGKDKCLLSIVPQTNAPTIPFTRTDGSPTHSPPGRKGDLKDRGEQKQVSSQTGMRIPSQFTSSSQVFSYSSYEALEGITQGKGMLEGRLSFGQKDWVREHLGKLYIHKSMGLDGMHPRVLRDLAEYSQAIHNHLWGLTEFRRGAGGLEERKCNPSLQKGQGGQPRELLTHQPCLSLCKGDGEPHSRGHLYPYGWQKVDQESSALGH